MTTFELNFSSSKGNFSLNVEYVNVLVKYFIPSSYLVPQASTITTTDELAIDKIHEALSRSPISPEGETDYALLVQANGSRWIVYGVKSESVSGTEDSSPLYQIKARMFTTHIENGVVIPQLKDNQSIFLGKKVQSALDGHQVKNKNRKRSASDMAKTNAAYKPSALVEDISTLLTVKAITETALPHTELIRSSRPQLSQGRKKEAITDNKSTSQESRNPDTIKPNISNEKVVKDKLKKMIVSLLSLQGITKSSPEFKDLYQHSLQASVFALRSTKTEVLADWEAQAMTVNQNLIRMFLGDKYKES